MVGYDHFRKQFIDLRTPFLKSLPLYFDFQHQLHPYMTKLELMGMYACFYIGCWIAPWLFISKADP
jgi:hypothetical protein